MKTKFIILLTILSGLLYCSNAFCTNVAKSDSISCYFDNYDYMYVYTSTNNSNNSTNNFSTDTIIGCKKKVKISGKFSLRFYGLYDSGEYPGIYALFRKSTEVLDLSDITEMDTITTKYGPYLYAPYNCGGLDTNSVNNDVFFYNETMRKNYKTICCEKISYNEKNTFYAGTFYNWPNLRKIILPPVLEVINSVAFLNDTSLDTIVVTNKTTMMTTNALFYYTYYYYYKGELFLWRTSTTEYDWVKRNVVMYVPRNLYTQYKANGIWNKLILIPYGDSTTTNITQTTSDETKPKIYPTLVTNTLNISGANQGTIIIYDLNGNAILRKEVETQIDVSDLPKGVYLVSINNLCVGKIIK